MKPLCAWAFALVMASASGAAAQATPWGDAPPPPLVVEAPADAPLVIESTGREQDVRLLRGGPVLCQTPCTLHLQPGPYMVSTSGRGLRMADIPVTLEPGGLRVQVRAASRARLVGGVILVSSGATVLVALGAMSVGALIAGSDDSYNRLIAGVTGTMAVVIGAPLLIGGLVMVNGAAAGPERIEPLTRPAWSVAVAPLAGGAMGALGVTF